jgi:hypothetical protein
VSEDLLVTDVGRGHHVEVPNQRRGHVLKNISVEIRRQDHVEMRRIADNVVRDGVDQLWSASEEERRQKKKTK